LYNKNKEINLYKLIKNKKILLYIVALQEAFTAIIPFFLLSSIISLIYLLFYNFDIKISFIDYNFLKDLSILFNSFSSLVAVVAISYFLAQRIKVSSIISAILSIASFIAILFFQEKTYLLKLPYGFEPITLITPLLSTFFISKFYRRFSLKIKQNDYSNHFFHLFNYLFVFIFAFIATVISYYILYFIFYMILPYINVLEFNMPNIIKLYFRDFFAQFFWFFGIHGGHTINAITTKQLLSQYLFPNLTFGEFNRLFVSIGGAGSGLALLISMLLFYKKDDSLKFITKISIPFVAFNINTILIYTIILFNRYLFVPFLVIPLVNITIAYNIIKISDITFSTYYISWLMPPFLDTFLKSNHNFNIMILQFFILIIDIFIYKHYIKKFSLSQSKLSLFEKLKSNLDVELELKSKKDLQPFIAKQNIIDANIKVNNIINSLKKGKLYIYYQPKIDITQKKVINYEALIRFSHNNKLIGPIFLKTLEEARLAPVIDIWVCKQIKKDIKYFKNQDFNPHININLHPDTLKSYDAITKIINLLKNNKITFEIIERSFLEKQTHINILRLKENGFKISIDDFGIGFTNLETFIKYDIDELKIDKSLIDTIETKKGYKICKHIISMCHDIGCIVVAEGVETKKQCKLLKEIKVDEIQGYYFSKAINKSEIKSFSQQLKQNC
jgi:EAL domain-containing protein (putative c-di-GMP-specific phosphodiesterase class I)/cellobiose-specific phosphotransferase system component IIC